MLVSFSTSTTLWPSMLWDRSLFSSFRTTWKRLHVHDDVQQYNWLHCGCGLWLMTSCRLWCAVHIQHDSSQSGAGQAETLPIIIDRSRNVTTSRMLYSKKTVNS